MTDIQEIIQCECGHGVDAHRHVTENRLVSCYHNCPQCWDIVIELRELQFVLRSWSVSERYNKDKFESAAYTLDTIIQRLREENKK